MKEAVGVNVAASKWNIPDNSSLSAQHNSGEVSVSDYSSWEWCSLSRNL